MGGEGAVVGGKYHVALHAMDPDGQEILVSEAFNDVIFECASDKYCCAI